MDAWAPHANYIENNHMKILFVIIFGRSERKNRPRVGLNHQPNQPNRGANQ